MAHDLTNPPFGARRAREASERFRAFACDELVARDEANLDIFWLKDDSLEDADSLPPPAVLAVEIIENLEGAEAVPGGGDGPGVGRRNGS